MYIYENRSNTLNHPKYKKMNLLIFKKLLFYKRKKYKF